MGGAGGSAPRFYRRGVSLMMEGGKEHDPRAWLVTAHARGSSFGVCDRDGRGGPSRLKAA